MSITESSATRKLIWLAPTSGAATAILATWVFFALSELARHREGDYLMNCMISIPLFAAINIVITVLLLPKGAWRRHLVSISVANLIAIACYLYLFMALLLNIIGS